MTSETRVGSGEEQAHQRAASRGGAPARQRAASRDATWISILTAVLLTRFSWAPAYLSTDAVNLAYSLEWFNPKLHQPQPPGYPLFVVFARFVHWFVETPEVVFWIISIVATAAATVTVYMLADRVVSRWGAMAATVLFLLNPVLWFSRLRSPLRPWLALFSALVAYCAWRCWNGERKFILWGALALGVGAGFRPDLLAYLFPLWAISAWKTNPSPRRMIQAAVIVLGLSASWLAVVTYAMGGMRSSIEVFTSYLSEQSSKDSLLFANTRLWFRPISRLVIWNATAVLGWFWVPIVAGRRLLKDDRWPFLALWVVPGLFIQLLIHIAAPGHTLFATPVWCVIGACVIEQVGRHRNTVLAIAALIGAALFLNAIPTGYPPSVQAQPLERAWISMKNSLAFGTFETSMERLRWWDEMAEVSLDELSRFNAPDRPNVTIVLNGNDTEFDFVNWRVVSYYLSDRSLDVLLDNLPPATPGRVRRVRGTEIKFMPNESIHIPRSARILWVMLPEGRFQRALEKIMPVHRGRYVIYTDPPYQRFQIEGFEFIPE
jgi:hypothetical protein